MISALTVVTPPAQPVVSTSLAQQHCRIDDSTESAAVLPLYIAAATSIAETFLSRALITQTLKWVVMQTPSPSYATAMPGVINYPNFGALRQPIVLPRAPVQSVTSVLLGDPAGGADQVLDTSEWVADFGLDPGQLRFTEGCLSRSMRHIAVTFVAGYGLTPASVPPPILAAVLLMVAWMHEMRGDTGDEMPAAAERLLWPYRNVSFGG